MHLQSQVAADSPEYIDKGAGSAINLPAENGRRSAMKLELRSFRTKVARRLFTLFVACAVVPILGLAWISFSQANRQIREQSRNRLAQDTKASGMSLLERLMLLSAELRIIASGLSAGERGPLQMPSMTLAGEVQESFASLALLTENGKYVPILGNEDIPRKLSHAELEHILAAKTLLRHQLKPKSAPAIYMYAALDPRLPSRGIVMAEINASSLWQVAEGRPAGTELYVLDQSKNILFSSVSDGSGIEEGSLSPLNSGHSGLLEWHDAAGAYLAGYWAIFLEPAFLSPGWFVLLRQSRDEAFAPLIDFRRAFALVIVMSFSAMLLLSLRLIRKNTGPIEILREATQEIAQGDFGHRIDIRSGDEFEALGKSFNGMREKLKEGRTLLIRAAKLSTMGQMAAGVIHEVRQPLTAISGLLQLVMLKEDSPQKRKHLETALGSVESLNAILERFRAFSRMSQEKMESLSLKQVVDQIHTLMEHQLQMKKIQCAVHAEEDLPPVIGDRQGLHQVFSNLVVNAVQAMEDKKEGQRALDIRLSSSGGKVLVEVKDTGCGMSADVMQHMFDPFFTTKDHDKGTGLGMAIVESILHKHEAKVEVESTVGVGTTLTLAFSVAPAEVSPSAR
jgi:signal transduction histidine kinase